MRVPSFVRDVTDPLLEGIRVPVLSGVNRGRWWSLVSAGGGYASGRRASAQMRLLAGLIRPGDVMWDVGAHHGFVTLCAARRVGAAGRVHAFEPCARNRAVLTRHVAWNGAANVSVHPFALSDHDGTSSFGGTGTSRMYALGKGAEIVQVRTAATLIAEGRCAPPTFVKLDVEGAEADALVGALGVFPTHARLLIAVHGREADARCSAILRDTGFELVPSRALARCRTGQWESDPDLFCIGPTATGGEADRALLDAMGF